MTARTSDDVRLLVKELGVRFVRLQITDILGAVKNVAIPVEQLDKALDGELMFDGSSIEGFVRIEESDMYLRPDPDTFSVYPWHKEGGATARLICDVYNPDGTPFAGCPRGILKRVMEEADALGYTCFAGPEPEFFLFERDENGAATLRSHDQAGYFDLSPVDRGESARRDMVLALQAMGFEIEASHHEVAPAQHEIDFQYADAVTTADRIATFRVVVRIIAMQHNLHATFMPKPVYGINGSGMHVHMSLFQGDKNAFFEPGAKMDLSDTALHFIGGLLAHAKEFTAITNPIVNSYKRLVPGYEAPVNIAWSAKNRSPLLRVPAKRGLSTRVELRSPDPSCNPYLALAVTFKAGLLGAASKMSPPPPVSENLYAMSAAERRERGIDQLPGNLLEAVSAMQASSLMRETLGDHVFERFCDAKRIEWDVYRTQVHPWEVERYLSVY